MAAASRLMSSLVTQGRELRPNQSLKLTRMMSSEFPFSKMLMKTHFRYFPGGATYVLA